MTNEEIGVAVTKALALLYEAKAFIVTGGDGHRPVPFEDIGSRVDGAVELLEPVEAALAVQPVTERPR